MAAGSGVPATVIYLDQLDGQRLLAEVQKDAAAGAYQPILHTIFSQQTTRAGCGIQSCALVLSANAIGCCVRSGLGSDKRTKTSLHVVAKKRKVEKEVGLKIHDDVRQVTSELLEQETYGRQTEVSSHVDGTVSMTYSGNLTLPYTEVGLYEMPATLAVTRRELVASHGLTLAEVAAILQGHGCTVRVVHASSGSPDQFRRDVSFVLAASDSRMGVIVNFHRGPLSTGTDVSRRSHHSPLVAYHKHSGRVLLLDTSAPREQHFWATIGALFTAMATIDKVSGLSRGYCLFSKSPISTN
jgi:hypothetical protein